MPTPREAYTNTVEQTPYSGNRVRAADFGAAGEAIGRAVQGFGQDLKEVAKDVDDIQTIYATAAAKDGLVKALPRLSAVRHSFTSQKKGDAIGAAERAAADVDLIEKEVLSQLKDKRAQRMFKDAFLDRRMSVLESITAHEHAQVLEYEDDTNIALRDVALNQAADSYGNETEMLTHLQAAQRLERKLRRGASADELAAADAEIMSKGLSLAWTQIEDPLEKEAFRQRYSDKIDPLTESRLIEKNAPGLFDARGDLIEADFFQYLTSPPGTRSSEPTTEGSELAPSKPINPVSGRSYDPTGGRARKRDGAAAHARRGSNNKGIDFAAPSGTPIRPPTSGEVVERGYNDTNGNYVKVRYDDGHTGIFLHLKGPPPVAKGAKVDPGTIIGSVGSTGRSSGPHVHYSVRNAAGDYVDPDTITYGQGRTVSTPPLQARDTDTAVMYEKAYAYAAEKNLTPRETEQLLRRIDVRANRERALQVDQERIATRAAEEQIVALGENLTKRSQISNYASLPPDAKMRIDNIIEANTRPPAVDANSETWRTLLELKHDNPEAFLNYDARSLRGKITESQLTSVIADQAKLRNQDGSVNDGAVDNFKRIRDIAKKYQYRVADADRNGRLTKDEVAKRDRYVSAVERRVQRRIEQNGGKDISMREYDQIAAEEAMVVYVNDKPMFSYQADEKGIPRSQRRIRTLDNAKIVWRRLYPGKPYPSDAELLRMASE